MADLNMAPGDGAAGGRPRGRSDVLLGAAPAVAAVLLTIVGLKFGKVLVFALLAAATLPWVPLGRRPGWARLRTVLAGALTLVLTAFALTVMYYQEHPGRVTVPPVHHIPSLAKAAAQLHFLPVAGPVPHCVSLAGAGHVPAGDDLVLFDRPTDSGGRYTSTSTFAFDGEAAASPTGSGWTAPDLNIGAGDAGDRGSHIAIVAVLMPRRTAAFLDALTGSSESGAVPRSVIGLGAPADKLVVVRNAQNAHC